MPIFGDIVLLTFIALSWHQNLVLPERRLIVTRSKGDFTLDGI